MKTANWLPLCSLLMLATAPAPATAGAQHWRPVGAASVVLEVENDYFLFWIPPQQRPDENYTNGIRLIAALRPVSGRRLSFELGQDMYTPTAESTEPVAGERPYAGWLYFGARADRLTEKAYRSVALRLGTTGPPALGEFVQRRYHAAAGFRVPVGWEHQLPTELGMLASFSRGVWHPGFQRGALRTDLTSELGVMLGTIRTSARVAGSGRIGYESDHPWLGVHRRAFTAVMRGAVEAELVGYDMFLDGGVFRRGHSVERVPLQFQGSWAADFRWHAVLASYQFNLRTREYRTGPKVTQFGALRAGVALSH